MSTTRQRRPAEAVLGEPSGPLRVIIPPAMPSKRVPRQEESDLESDDDSDVAYTHQEEEGDFYVPTSPVRRSAPATTHPFSTVFFESTDTGNLKNSYTISEAEKMEQKRLNVLLLAQGFLSLKTGKLLDPSEQKAFDLLEEFRMDPRYPQILQGKISKRLEIEIICTRILSLAKQYKIETNAMFTKIKAIVDLWNRFLKSEQWCDSWTNKTLDVLAPVRRNLLPESLGGIDCHAFRLRVLAEIKKSGMFERIYINAAESYTKQAGRPVRNGQVVDPSTDTGKQDWFDPYYSRFAMKELAEAEKKAQSHKESLRPEMVQQAVEREALEEREEAERLKMDVERDARKRLERLNRLGLEEEAASNLGKKKSHRTYRRMKHRRSMH